MQNTIIALSFAEIELISGGTDNFEKGRKAGEAFGEAVEDAVEAVGEAISDAWNWLTN